MTPIIKELQSQLPLYPTKFPSNHKDGDDADSSHVVHKLSNPLLKAKAKEAAEAYLKQEKERKKVGFCFGRKKNQPNLKKKNLTFFVFLFPLVPVLSQTPDLGEL